MPAGRSLMELSCLPIEYNTKRENMNTATQTQPARRRGHKLLFISLAGLLAATAVWYRMGVNDRLPAQPLSSVALVGRNTPTGPVVSLAQQLPSTARPLLKEAAQRHPPSEAEMIAKVTSNIALLDDRLRDEPISLEWANRNERHIEAFFLPAHLAQEGIAAPMAMKATCHSATCRVSALYSDETAAQDASQLLTLHVAGGLPYGAVMPRRLDDGTLELNMWLSSKRIAL